LIAENVGGGPLAQQFRDRLFVPVGLAQTSLPAVDDTVTLVIWTNLTLSPEGKTTAQALLPTVLDEIYAGLSLAAPPSATPTPTPTPTPTR
jgi:hypothetical protein